MHVLNIQFTCIKTNHGIICKHYCQRKLGWLSKCEHNANAVADIWRREKESVFPISGGSEVHGGEVG